MMRQPKRLAVRIRKPISLDISVLLTCKFAGEKYRGRGQRRQIEKWTLTQQIRSFP